MSQMVSDYVQAGDYIEYADDPDRWGIVTCLSDCGEGVYYNPKGASLSRSCVRTDRLVIRPARAEDRPGSRPVWQIITA